MNKKIFVLDTNVLLHDSGCYYSFKDNDIVIPIEVLSELDHFKKGDELINRNSRNFTRFLDKLPADKIFNGGATLGEGLGKIRVVMSFSYHEEIRKFFSDEAMTDHKIINTVYVLANDVLNKDKEVIFISKDVNLRLKAKALGLKSEDYQTDIVQDVNSLYEDIKNISIKNSEIDSLYEREELCISSKIHLQNNEFVILSTENIKKTALAIHRKGNFYLIKKESFSSFGIKPKNSEQSFALSILLNPQISLITIIGKAGTGKTLLAIATMLQQLEESKFDKLLFTRKTIELGNRENGFLPGDIGEKIHPYMNGFFDNLSVIKNSPQNEARVNKLKSQDKFAIEALGYIRGRSLINTAFIIDEAQNLTPKEVKAIVTRAGEGTKIIFTGDITQIDDPYLDERSNGLSYLINRMKEQDFYGHVVLKKGERSHLAEIAGNLL